MKLVSNAYIAMPYVHNIIISPSAITGSDYFAINTSKTFRPGSSTNEILCVVIVLIDDYSLERDQIFTVIVTTTDTDVIIDNFTTSIRIFDNDG